MPALTQLIYWSRPVGDGYAAETDLREILSQSRVRNQHDGVSGALLAGAGWFAQVLEGAPEAVQSVVARIQRDPRHHDIVILPERNVTERGFPDWSMAFAMSGVSETTELVHVRACDQHDEAAAEATLALILESTKKFQLW